MCCNQIDINMERFTWAELPTFTWHIVQCMATAGKHRGFITSIFWTVCVQIIVCLLLSTVAYGKQIHLQWTGRWWSSHMLQFDEDVLQCFENNPSTSTCTVGVDCHLVWNFVGEQQCHPFHWQQVQALGPNDHLCWDQFVGWLVHHSMEKPIFLQCCWSWMRPASPGRDFQQPCLGRSKPSSRICSLPPTTACSQCFGRHYAWLFDWALSPWWLTAQIHWVFLADKLPEMLEEIPLALRRNMRFQHNRAAAHFACQVQEHLTATYNNCWNGRSEPVAWPLRSPDITSISSYGATLKPWFTRHQLTLKRILLPVLLRWQQPGIVEGTHQSLLQRCWLCIEVSGSVLEHLL